MEALNRYLDAQDKAGEKYEEFRARVENDVKPLYNETREAYKQLLSEFDYDETDMPFEDEMEN